MITSAEIDINRRIDLWVAEDKKCTVDEVKKMPIQHKMSYVNMRDMVKWNEFKLALRKRGYII